MNENEKKSYNNFILELACLTPRIVSDDEQRVLDEERCADEHWVIDPDKIHIAISDNADEELIEDERDEPYGMSDFIRDVGRL